MRASYEEVLAGITTFVTNHQILQSFFTNDITDRNKRDVIYPIAFARLDTTTANISVVEMSIPILFVDKLNKDNSNYVKVVSNMLTAAISVKTRFRDTKRDLDWWIAPISSISPPFKSTLLGDKVAGVELTAVVRTPYDVDRNDLPVE